MEERFVCRRDHLCVGDDAIDSIIAKRSWEAHEVQLYRGGPRGNDPEPPSERVAMALDQEVDRILANDACGLGIADLANVAPVVERRANALADRAATGAVTVAEQLEARTIVLLEEPRHQPARRMVAEVAGEVAHAQPSLASRDPAPWRHGRQRRRRPATRDRELLCG